MGLTRRDALVIGAGVLAGGFAAAAHAADTAGLVYDVLNSDPVEGERLLELRRDGAAIPERRDEQQSERQTEWAGVETHGHTPQGGKRRE